MTTKKLMESFDKANESLIHHYEATATDSYAFSKDFENYNHTLSPARKRKHPRILTRAACILAFICLTASMLLLFSSDTRATFFGLFQSVNSTGQNTDKQYEDLLTKSTYIIKHQTIDRQVYTYPGCDGKIKAYFVINIAYVYDTKTDTPIQICDAKVLNTYLTSVKSYNFKTGGFTVRLTDDVVRISATGQFAFDSKISIATNDYIEKTEDGYLTSVQTYFSEIHLSQLHP